ncbi:MAG: DNA/RNA nuclease SfsA, partial [Candidatus Thermoplasmatota archaeon]
TCSLLRGRRAVFPDAPTARGTRHVSHLAELAARGDAAALLILVLRRAERFSPNDETDPEFVRALRSAKEAGVDIIARRAHLRGLRLEVDRRIPIDLSRGGR